MCTRSWNISTRANVSLLCTRTIGQFANHIATIVNSDWLSLAQLLELHKVADYFSVDSLQDDIIAELHKRLQEQARVIWKNKETSKARGHSSGHWSEDKLNQFFAAAKLAYTEPQFFGFWRKTIIRFLKMTYVIIGRDRRFTKALKGVPELAVDIVELIMDTKHQGEKSMVAMGKPKYCYNCSYPENDPYGKTWVSSTSAQSQSFVVRGYCQSCNHEDSDDNEVNTDEDQ